jgi:N-acetylneuraminate synthase|tara:strand:+ start:867 stop:2303 length:1437 start_codon:yes stop_codon:yes gene_type:complete
MANNHQGSLEHALRIIDEFSLLAKKNKISAAIKFQFRQLDTFIHDHYKNSDLKYVKRFNSTKMSQEDFRKMTEYAKSKSLLTMATPFDNESLPWINQLDIDIVKIASCSCDDWPLLNEVSKINRRVIISTAGIEFTTLDRVYNLFKNNGRDFSFMHCIGEYPTPLENSNLKRIKTMQQRYRDINIGISTHESPTQKSIVPYAVAMGCKIIEKHVGVETEEISLNAYSCTAKDIQKVIDEVSFVQTATEGESSTEKASLRNLKRGIYLINDLDEDQIIKEEHLYYAMPLQDGQASTAEIRQVVGSRARSRMTKDSIVELSGCFTSRDLEIMNSIKTQTFAALSDSKIAVDRSEEIEISAHYGLENFSNTGCVIINKINREYCKKLLIMQPKQAHPMHHHVKKEETFELLSGDCSINLNNKIVKLKLGKPVLIPRGVDHSFSSENGCVIEEISTTHFKGDSVYEDPEIFKLKLSERKFFI